MRVDASKPPVEPAFRATAGVVEISRAWADRAASPRAVPVTCAGGEAGEDAAGAAAVVGVVVVARTACFAAVRPSASCAKPACAAVRDEYGDTATGGRN